nr:MerR family DNA-binding transcriptional regulator [Catenulispora acidiphila]
MDVYRMGEAAELLGVSADTVRRWADAGRLSATRDENGHRVIPGPELAAFASSLAAAADERSEVSSARNRLRGIITAVTKDAVMAQVDIQAGPFRVVSLMSREAVDELDLRVGATAVAVIKSTTVVVERAAARAPHVGRTKTDEAADSAVVVEPEHGTVQTVQELRGRS